MKTAIYPGSFNPWHAGHEDILTKALKVFDHVLVAIGHNPEKRSTNFWPSEQFELDLKKKFGNRVQVNVFHGLLVDALKSFDAQAVIRGLRNGNDLQYEQNQQYWNEDLGLKIPIVYFITDRTLGHISSSAIRAIEAIKK